MTAAERPAAICARCGMAVNYMLKTAGRPDEPEFVWVHGGPAGHDPVLAPSAGSPRLYCDFCSAPDPEWVIDTDRDFQIVVADQDGGSLTENFTGGWAACSQCAELARAGQGRALLARAAASIPFTSASEHAAYRARAAQVHAAFFASGPQRSPDRPGPASPNLTSPVFRSARRRPRNLGTGAGAFPGRRDTVRPMPRQGRSQRGYRNVAQPP
jgi:hypothetical protein